MGLTRIQWSKRSPSSPPGLDRLSPEAVAGREVTGEGAGAAEWSEEGAGMAVEKAVWAEREAEDQRRTTASRPGH